MKQGKNYTREDIRRLLVEASIKFLLKMGKNKSKVEKNRLERLEKWLESQAVEDKKERQTNDPNS